MCSLNIADGGCKWGYVSNKLEEAKRYLKPLGMEVEQMMIDGSIPELIEPQFDDLEKIAIFKADQAIAMIPESEKSDCAILGCTELSVISLKHPFIFDPLRILTYKTIKLWNTL